MSVGSRRGEGQAASSKRKGKEASTKKGRQRSREKERDRGHRDHCLPTTGGTTAYLQLQAPRRREKSKQSKLRFLSIFSDFLRFSTTYNDFQQFSTIFNNLEVRGAPGPCLGAHKRKIRLFKTIDLGATVMENWPPDCIVFLLFSRFWIYIFAAWSAKYQLLIGIFWA